MPQGLLLDLDDTLYDYAPAARAAEADLFATLGSMGVGNAKDAWARARAAVKARTAGTAASHSRLLYLAELAHEDSRLDLLPRCLELDARYWEVFLATARLRDGARELLEGFRGRGGRIALVTDLTLAVQLRKLSALGLLSAIDALVTSEEAGAEKPDPRPFQLAAARLGVSLRTCVVLGDTDERDGEGARRLNLPFFLAPSSTTSGIPLPELARILEAMP